jgi:hypothetical protein
MGPGKSLKVLEFFSCFFQALESPGKLVMVLESPGKVLEKRMVVLEFFLVSGCEIA